MRLEWTKCKGGVWCPLNTVNLNHLHFDDMEGVYIIWHEGGLPAMERVGGQVTVRVGQGVIRDRLQAHREDKVQAYSHLGLLVTWASVPEKYRDGVEAYLAQRLEPKIGERFPDVDPIEVNLP